jgi:LysM repeat protein
MSKKDDPQKMISSYKRRQQVLPFVIWGMAVLLIVVGVIILVVWLIGPNKPQISLFASQTPTSTSTATATPVTPTATATITPTSTETPTVTVTPTRSGPIEYTVLENDTCYDISAIFDIDMLVLLAINNFEAGSCPIRPGDKIIIPAPNQELPTATPWPANLPRGTKLPYVVQFGDTLDLIASKFLSTIEEIMKLNNMENANQIFAGQVLQVPVNLVTATPTSVATVTPTVNVSVTATP